MSADEAAGERTDDLAGILRRDRITEHRSGDGIRRAMADDRRDAGQEPAESEPHQKPQKDKLPRVGDKSLRNEEQSTDGEAARDHVPMADPVGELAKPRG